MQIDKTTTDGQIIISPVGSVNTLTSTELEQVLGQAVTECSDIVLDFSQMNYISSAGFRVLLTAHKALMASGGGITIRNMNEEVSEVFEVTGLIDVFTVE